MLCTGEIVANKCEDGYILKVGKKGGRIKFLGEKGKLGGINWTSDKNLVIPLRNDTYHSFYFGFYLYAQDGSFVLADFGTLPFMDVEVAFPLTFLNLETVFMPRTAGRLKNMMHGTAMKAEDVVAVELYVPESSTECEIHYKMPYLSDEMPDYDMNLEAQVDEFGQWKKKEWAGKTHSLDELKENLTKALEEELPTYKIKRSKFGGELDRQVNGTGFFRIHEENGRYWLCDPEGYLMFSCGVDCIIPRQETRVDGSLGKLYENLPKNKDVYSDSWVNGLFSHLTNNLIKVFGENWYSAWKTITAKRLRSWGFNSIANWADVDFEEESKISFVLQGDFPKTEKTLFRSMPDVFSKEYKANAKTCAQYLNRHKDNPYMIGYFMRNEPDWAFGEYNIASIMLEKDENFATKEVLIRDMYRKYVSIENFNNAWNLSLKDFDELKKPIEKAHQLSEKSESDLKDFTRKIIREYVRIPAEAYRQVDPNHLNLGLRWGWLSTDDLVEACEYCDVFSMNCYKECPDKEHFDRIHKMTGMPIMLGEFQVGSLDVGMMANGMYGVSSQAERGNFFRYYVEKTAELPYMLGAHYFQWNDQAVLGRFDGENLNIGLVDVCNKPYDDFVDGIKITNENLAKIHAGEMTATEQRSDLVPKEGF